MSNQRVRARLGGLEVGDECPIAIIGVLNVSPESFHAGSVVTDLDELERRAAHMVAAGAAILDVGGMSTAPYRATAVSEGEEADRLARAVSRLAARAGVPISADVSRDGAARAALDAGATIINDVSGFREDRRLASSVAARGAAVILTASPRGTGFSAAARPVDAVRRLLLESLDTARAAGVPDERVVLDPGIGFVREASVPWYEWDTAVLDTLGELGVLGRPLCVGVSRKSFIGVLTGRDHPGERLAGSLAATAIAVHRGAALIRTHDVGDTRDAVRVAAAIRAGGLVPAGR